MHKIMAFLNLRLCISSCTVFLFQLLFFFSFCPFFFQHNSSLKWVGSSEGIIVFFTPMVMYIFLYCLPSSTFFFFFSLCFSFFFRHRSLLKGLGAFEGIICCFFYVKTNLGITPKPSLGYPQNQLWDNTKTNLGISSKPILS